MEKKTDPYRPLFDHMDQEHGLILLDSEMADIIHLVEKMQQVRPQGAATDDEIKAAWKKRMGINFDEYGAMQDYCFYQQGYEDAASSIEWVKADRKPDHNVGVLVFIPDEDNHITSGMWDISNEWVLLDEYRTPEVDITHWMPLPSIPEGYSNYELPVEIIDAIKDIAKEMAPELKSAVSLKENDRNVIEFIRDCADNWDCDEDGHKYNTGCRKCNASELLYELTKRQKEIDKK